MNDRNMQDAASVAAIVARSAADQRRRRRRRRLALGATLVTSVAAVALWATTLRRPAIRYVVEPVGKGALHVTVTATGSVQPTIKVDVSSELSGTIRKVYVDYNSPVAARQPLAELDTDKLSATAASSRARLAAARARVTDAQATLREKERDLARKRELRAKGFVSVQELDLAIASEERAVAALASAGADVDVAAADLRLNETNLAKSVIVSPIAGVVLKRNVDPGQTVAATLQAPVLFSIAEDLRKMELQVDVDEADVGKVATGQKAHFSVDAFPDRKFPAEIRDIRYASETLQGVVTYKAILSIENNDLALRPGMTATADIHVEDIADALLAPNAALRFTPPARGPADNRSFVARLLPGPAPFRPPSRAQAAGPNRTVHVLNNGRLAPRHIVVGASDGKKTVVVSGELAAGEKVVVDQVRTAP